MRLKTRNVQAGSIRLLNASTTTTTTKDKTAKGKDSVSVSLYSKRVTAEEDDKRELEQAVRTEQLQRKCL